MRDLTPTERSEMRDLRGAAIVGVQISPSPNGKLTLWVCLEGACILRITSVEEFEFTDDRLEIDIK